MAYYRVNISAYNQAGESPQAIYIVPDFSATGTYHSFIRAMGKFYEQSVIYLLSVFGTGLSISWIFLGWYFCIARVSTVS